MLTIWGLLYHLNRGTGGEEKALIGKQMTFMKTKCRLRRMDGRYDSFVITSVLGNFLSRCLLLISGDKESIFWL